jgi:hypothetical protein
MNGFILKALALNEVRLRMRRLSTIVAVLAVVALSWLMIDDPAGGTALLVANKARVLYNSAALALGSAALAALLFGLGGFYLVRGRIAEDVRSGVGGVIGATPVGNALFLIGRWLGGVAYLGLLLLAFLGTVLVLHVLRGEGPIEPLVYLQVYALVLLPTIFFVVACAMLFDSWAPLMGKRGDVLFFFVWVAQLSTLPLMSEGGGSPWLALVDFSGTNLVFSALATHLATNNIGVGMNPFDPHLAPLVLPSVLWETRALLMRAGATVLALLPLLPAVLLFHRFSGDKVKLSSARRRRSPLALLNGALAPLSALVQPLFRLAARLPGFAGQAVAELALTLVAAPAAIAALLVMLGAALLVKTAALGPLMLAGVALWGVLMSDISTRDFTAGTEQMTDSVRGGRHWRYARQLSAALLLGLMFMGVIALRMALEQPLRALAALIGLFALASLASLFGRCSRTSRTFLALFLFGLYVLVNATTVPFIDVVGVHGVATVQSALTWLAIGTGALALGLAWNRRD